MTHTVTPGNPAGQGDLLDLLNETGFHPGDPGPEVRAIADTLTGDQLHETDRIRCVAAILADALDHDGQVNPNRVRVRPELVDEHGNLIVYPRVLPAVYSAMTRTGHLRFDQWVISDDVRGRNAGKPARAYILTTVSASAGIGGAA